jgi:phage tail-like protein
MSDPAVGIRFEVTIDGLSVGSFTECDGLQAEYEVYEYQEGGQNGYVHRIPGRLKFSNVKLSRPIDKSSIELAAWFASLQAIVKRQTAAITAFDGNNAMVAQWNLVDVYPVRWAGPTLNVDGNQVAKETLELAHNGFLPEMGGLGAGTAGMATAARWGG